MHLGSAHRRPRGENIVPMINVVFLLLVFFLMVAQIAPPDPVPLTLPEGGEPSTRTPGPVAHFDARGEVLFEGARGTAALARLAEQAGPGVTLTIRAEATADAAALAVLLRDFGGFGTILLATVPQ